MNFKPDRPIEVVDGQQRLTTITILFSALSDKFKEIGKETLSKELFKYILSTNVLHLLYSSSVGWNLWSIFSKSSLPVYPTNPATLI